ncbi:ubiquinol-cytochrome c reductase iron-sulfur subunit [Spirosoma montaniterrae]|uniref:(2Fe-2S)-binding protein n=1 Tax=Spirosoma montaniterrae TaxID=1178516 RepID=A0A1P9X2T4_9BACT|nr:Rieske (2Fe-2S) protein [Spirosoma montaniterrae]AQG81913.1 (2Fe-2S)-binding protein [Spirosoma montaniterrae]
METKPTINNQQSRAEFLRSLGLSSAALMAFYCMGTLTSCSSDSDDPAPAPAPPSNVDFTLDLTTSDFSKLKTIGQFAYRDSIIVARVKDGSYVALSKACTHQGTDVQYRLNEDDFWCSNHGSEFGANGVVQVGPAARALTVYKTALSTDGNRLRVTA